MVPSFFLSSLLPRFLPPNFIYPCFKARKCQKDKRHEEKDVDKIVAMHTGLHIRFHSFKMILYIKEA